MNHHEINYRAWDTNNKCFWYSEKFPALSKFFEYMENIYANDNEIVFEPTTGLKYNTKEDIYPGDIVIWGNRWWDDESPEDEVCHVFYENATYYITHKGHHLHAWGLDLKKIGNIHENPELLKAKYP